MKLTTLLATSAVLVTASVAAKEYQINHTNQLKSLNDATKSTEVWEQAEVLTDFTYPWEKETAPKTDFRALWSDDALYFRFIADDKDIQLGDNQDKDQAVLDSDRVELFFTTSPELKPYYTAEMDPKGRTFDAKANYYREVDPSWNWETLQTVGEITPNGYVLTGKIDLDEFTKLNLWQDADKQTLMCAILRGEFSAGEPKQVRKWISWIKPDSVKPDFHIPSAFGTCKFVK
ncbi:TPA: carbohydrate-binding family 9-like protein [Providencia rettgeri]|uniref:carbohydrate-binding family 9-like protein n=1 Tax=Providencia TaxID=586 RepID=UPI001B36F1D0|nr:MULTISPECIES: carbohydrate-binding family 9-like protein [Providencia]EMB5786380.1 carbohydrate-binding family 9-like protein [Providencia rettgeri]MBQ0365571.1 carbohydrate-binding family 9-like protein [Providencia rettgeri]MDK7745775.1 carbohydrate-binding family 9-like protein [Providencia rettgeri]MDK7758221.1 carbohydrate-binding family 9-like protein [Providencia rettgeri]HBC7429175.1 carbohydrate-binding family 9-like protein [Providencia rettgeri]